MSKYFISVCFFCQFQFVHAVGEELLIAPAADKFSKNISGQLIQLLYDAGAIRKETNVEDTGLKKRMIERHHMLDDWFRSKGKHVTWEQCKNEIDKTNYIKFRQMMANRDFLQLGLNQRLKYIRAVNDYLDVFLLNFLSSLTTLINSNTADSDKHQKLLIERVVRQLNKPVSIQIRYFNRNRFTMTGALYLPNEPAIYINLNELIRSGPDFIDSVEHEMWHHLLPPRNDSGDFATLWFEGFTETVSEIWSSKLHQNVPADQTGVQPSKTIQYPVQTAFVSLFFGLENQSALNFFSGFLSAQDFAAEFRINSGNIKVNRYTTKRNKNAYDSDLRKCLMQVVLSMNTISKHDQLKIEKILSNWGWREDNGKPVTVSRYLDDGVLSNRLINKAYRYERQLFLDFIQAMTIVQLQKIQKSVSISKAAREFQLPDHLIKNIKKVAGYVNNPYHQFANR